MAYTITCKCIACDRCQSQCPTGAIENVNGKYFIDSDRCNSCVGYYRVPQCAAICPTNSGCISLPTDYWQVWFTTYNRLIWQLKGEQKTSYWERWFEHYSQQLKPIFQESLLST